MLRSKCYLNILGLLVACLAFTGCATSANDYYNEYWTKAEPQARANYVVEKKDWYGKGYKLGYHTDLALTYLRAADLVKANEELRFADDVIDDNFKKDYPGMITAFSVSEEYGDYSGDPYEQVQIPMLRSLIFAQQKKWETARAMGRRTNDTIQAVVQKIVKAHGFDADLSNDDGSKIGEKGKVIKWHYVKDAFAFYISAAAAYNERDNENALALARSSIQTYKTPTYQNNYLVKSIPEPVSKLYCHLVKTIDNGAIRSLDKKLAAEICNGVAAFEADKGEAVIVVLHGKAATKQSLNVDIRLDQYLVYRLIAGAAVPLFKAFVGGDDDSPSDKTAERNGSAGKKNAVYDILLGLVFADPYIRIQIALQVAELELRGSKGLGSGVANAVGALSEDVMRLSVPMYLWHPNPLIPTYVNIGENKVTKVSLASNLDGIRDRELFDTMNMSMVRSLSRSFFRLAIADGAGRAGGPMAKLAVGAATKAAESSETRSLRLLPQSVYMLSTSLKPGDYPLSGGELNFSANKISVEPKKISFVIAFSGAN